MRRSTVLSLPLQLVFHDYTNADVRDSEEHTSLLHNSVNYGTDPFTVNYSCNKLYSVGHIVRMGSPIKLELNLEWNWMGTC